MTREEVQTLLNDFGFSVSLNKRIGNTQLIHMMHSGVPVGRFVEYHIDETLDLIETIMGFSSSGMEIIETTSALKNWLDL